jgi:hypothetical protein
MREKEWRRMEKNVERRKANNLSRPCSYIILTSSKLKSMIVEIIIAITTTAIVGTIIITKNGCDGNERVIAIIQFDNLSSVINNQHDDDSLWLRYFIH